MSCWSVSKKLEEEMSFSTTVGKVRRRFCEMTEQFLLMEHHNAQPGTIHRESRHHEMLTKIYSIYNCWPHERYVVKQEKPKITRNRQVHSQLSWNDDESRTLLELYPQVLVAHHSNGDDQPIEEFWIQLAKAYLNARNVRKRCSEIENHIALLRRGFQSQNPFPFVVEMQLLEETESTLGFTPDPLPVDTDQLVPYWSHRAAHLLLDFLMHYRLGGIETCKVYEKISRDLANCGYRFTGVECRNYHLLLRRLYKERKKTRRNGEPYKTFPYTEKMAKLISTRSRPKIAAYGKAYWNEENLLTMLNTVKEYRLLCHDSAELERVLSSDELWNEVASRQNASHKLHPSKCLQHFSLTLSQYLWGGECGHTRPSVKHIWGGQCHYPETTRQAEIIIFCILVKRVKINNPYCYIKDNTDVAESSRLCRWKATTVAEMYLFLGTVMPHMYKHNIAQYWSTDP
nr:uncharacterized protein LOC128685938 [Cherax quadricarinatus]